MMCVYIIDYQVVYISHSHAAECNLVPMTVTVCQLLSPISNHVQQLFVKSSFILLLPAWSSTQWSSIIFNLSMFNGQMTTTHQCTSLIHSSL